MNWHRDGVEAAAAELEELDAPDSLRWTLSRAPLERLVLASSFGAEDMVLLELCRELGRWPRVITLDTGRLPPETYELIQLARARYGIAVEMYAPDSRELEEMLRLHGPNLFYQTLELRRLCCQVRKIEPLRRALSGCCAWITGLRRQQSPGRAGVATLSWDGQFGLAKLCPLASWTEEQVWAFLKQRRAPYNRLHDQGYPSIGCAPCTRAVRPGEDARAGRWWWERQTTAKECGLHPKGR